MEEDKSCSSGRVRGLLFGWFGVRFLCEPDMLVDQGGSVAEESGCERNLLTGLAQKKSNFISENAFQLGESDWI